MLITEFMHKMQTKYKGKSKDELIAWAGEDHECFSAKDGAKFFLAGCGLFNYDVILACNYIYLSYHYIKRKVYTEKELLEEVGKIK